MPLLSHVPCIPCLHTQTSTLANSKKKAVPFLLRDQPEPCTCDLLVAPEREKADNTTETEAETERERDRERERERRKREPQDTQEQWFGKRAMGGKRGMNDYLFDRLAMSVV